MQGTKKMSKVNDSMMTYINHKMSDKQGDTEVKYFPMTEFEIEETIVFIKRDFAFAIHTYKDNTQELVIKGKQPRITKSFVYRINHLLECLNRSERVSIETDKKHRKEYYINTNTGKVSLERFDYYIKL